MEQFQTTQIYYLPVSGSQKSPFSQLQVSPLWSGFPKVEIKVLASWTLLGRLW